MDLGIAGRVALVTASSAGLGLAVAQALADEGAKVVLSARGEARLEEAAEDLRRRGSEVLTVAGDVTLPEAPRALLSAATGHFGRLDILVANAGGPPPARSLEVDDEQVRAAVEANLLASVRLVREVVPVMRRQRWGRICLVTSVAVVRPIPTLALSNLARSGLWAWAQTAAADLAAEGSGITLNLACPGYHATQRMVELGATAGAPMGDPADFGRVVAFMCSEPARFLSGETVVVDGAQRHAH
jgi:3-oxoacyl-[acyl-carrier protein] reductase